MRTLLAWSAFFTLGLPACQREAPPQRIAPSMSIASKINLVDVTSQVGLDFVHTNGAVGKRYMPETMGSGCAFVDVDRDGWLDIVLVDGKPWSKESPNSAVRLYLNEQGRQFREASSGTVPHLNLYGMGVSSADYDNDGWPDLFLTGVGDCRLLRNVAANSGQRRFEDVTSQAGIPRKGWSTSSTWLDYDRDGLLDLFICRYVQWSPSKDKFYTLDGVTKSYSTPDQYVGDSCLMLRNLGNGKFIDVSSKAGVAIANSKALGVVALDVDQDGYQDLVVANDTTANFLFHNQADGTFRDIGLQSGIALTEMGKAKAGMGIDAIDDRNNGEASIVITNFSGEQMTLYRRTETGAYLDHAALSGIGNASQIYLGFGVTFLDVDLDGWADLLAANGHIQDDAEKRASGVKYREPPLLFRNGGDGKYSDISRSAGEGMRHELVGRGLAWGDYDNDGDPDVLITSNGGRAVLLRNELTGANWIRLELEGRDSNRSAIGARVRCKTATGSITRSVRAGNSYLSQSDQRVLVGLGDDTGVQSVEILWPSGRLQELGKLEPNRAYHVTEGEAPKPAPRPMQQP